MKVISLTIITIVVYLALSHMLPFSRAGVPQTSGIEQAELSAAAVADAAVLDQASYGGEKAVQLSGDPALQKNSEPVQAVILDQPVSQVQPVQEITSVPVSSVAERVDVSVESSVLAVEVQPEINAALAPELESFIASVENGQAGVVAGVYVPNVLALPVVQQPNGQTGYVAEQDQVVTQFAMPAAHGTLGLLAHNYLSGRHFFNLAQDTDAYVVFGDGQVETYRINKVQSFQALNPTSVYSNFIDVNDPAQTVISAGQLFNDIYTTPDQLVFQTCIDANGNPSWGRLFVTAQKLQ